MTRGRMVNIFLVAVGCTFVTKYVAQRLHAIRSGHFDATHEHVKIVQEEIPEEAFGMFI